MRMQEVRNRKQKKQEDNRTKKCKDTVHSLSNKPSSQTADLKLTGLTSYKTPPPPRAYSILRSNNFPANFYV